MATFCDFVPPVTRGTLQAGKPHPAALDIHMHAKNVANLGEEGFFAAQDDSGTTFEFSTSPASGTDFAQFKTLNFAFTLFDLKALLGHGSDGTKTIALVTPVPSKAGPIIKSTEVGGTLTFSVALADVQNNTIRFVAKAKPSTIVSEIRVSLPPNLAFPQALSAVQASLTPDGQVVP